MVCRRREEVAGVGLHRRDVGGGRGDSRIRDVVTLASPFIEAIEQLLEPASKDSAGAVDSDGMRILAASDPQSRRSKHCVHGTDAGTPVKNDATLRMGRIFSIRQESFLLER